MLVSIPLKSGLFVIIYGVLYPIITRVSIPLKSGLFVIKGIKKDINWDIVSVSIPLKSGLFVIRFLLCINSAIIASQSP